MGNIKESIIPYFKKEMKLAMLSFDLYGAISPTQDHKKNDDLDKEPTVKKDRTLSQVELESSAPSVSLICHPFATLSKTVL